MCVPERSTSTQSKHLFINQFIITYNRRRFPPRAPDAAPPPRSPPFYDHIQRCAGSHDTADNDPARIATYASKHRERSDCIA